MPLKTKITNQSRPISTPESGSVIFETEKNE